MNASLIRMYLATPFGSAPVVTHVQLMHVTVLTHTYIHTYVRTQIQKFWEVWYNMILCHYGDACVCKVACIYVLCRHGDACLIFYWLAPSIGVEATYVRTYIAATTCVCGYMYVAHVIVYTYVMTLLYESSFLQATWWLPNKGIKKRHHWLQPQDQHENANLQRYMQAYMYVHACTHLYICTFEGT